MKRIITALLLHHGSSTFHAITTLIMVAIVVAVVVAVVIPVVVSASLPLTSPVVPVAGSV